MPALPHARSPRATSLLAVGVAALLGVGLTAAPAVATVPPVHAIARDFADPAILKAGNTYYAYSTGGNGSQYPQVASSASVNGGWTVRPNVLSGVGPWATADRTWAPDVTQRPDGSYLMYYTAHSVNPDTQCIGAAVANSPAGPFNPVGSAPLVCPAGLGGAIDASTFVDTDGSRYMLYKNDGNSIGRTTTLWLQPVTADGLGLLGGPTPLLSNDQGYEYGVIEAPYLVHQGAHYVLFYAGGRYYDDTYFTSYATATSRTGPYTKGYRPLITTASTDNAVHGPGGASVLRESGGDHIVFHGVTNTNPLTRDMYVADLGWAGDYPVVRGSRVRYEAENYSAIRDCAARPDSGASNGAVVGHIDHPDSYVSITVFAPSAGNYTVHAAFANGSASTATHHVSVNGNPVGDLGYPVTGWENWHQAAIDVNLNAGWNTVTFAHGTNYAELDYIEVS